MRIGLIVNPSAGGNRGAQVGLAVSERLRATEHSVLELSGSDLAKAKENGERAIADKSIDALIVVGGDGMAHLGVNLLAQTTIPLGIIPAGTGNDAAAALGMPKDPLLATELVLENLERAVAIDAISLSYQDQSSWALGSASAGFDALVNARANRMSWPKGPNRYYVAMLLELASFRPVQYRAVIDGTPKHFQAMLCAVSNTGVFGGGMLITPEASVTDGQLDLLIVNKINRFRFIRIFPKVYKGTHVSDPAVEIIRARSIRIEAGQMPIYSDGEYVGTAPFEARVVPGALRVIAVGI